MDFEKIVILEKIILTNIIFDLNESFNQKVIGGCSVRSTKINLFYQSN